MAALDDSPSRCQGQPWTVWADRMGFSEKLDDSQEEDVGKNKREGDAMKLRKEDMALFGFCPAQDDFYLVVCGVCEQVVKPQALQSHMELRHRDDTQRTHKGSHKQHGEMQTTTSSSSSSRCQPSSTAEKDGAANSSLPSPSPLNVTTAVTNSTSSTTTSSSSATLLAPPPPPPHAAVINNTRAKNPALNAQLSRHSSTGTHHRGTLVPGQRTLSLGTLPGLAPRQSSPQATPPPPSNSRKANGSRPSNPVVRVERIPQNLMPRKGGPKKEIPSPEQPPPQLAVATANYHGSAAVALSQRATAGTILANSNHVVHQAIVAAAATKKVAAGAEAKAKPKSKSKTPSERKLLPCKDRVYDADKHCGVWAGDMTKPCTRSLTCKTHSLAMRRNVAGRKKNFDELLSDHRAAKEAEAAAKAAQAAVVAGLDRSSTPCPVPGAGSTTVAGTVGPVTHTNSNAANNRLSGLVQNASKAGAAQSEGKKSNCAAEEVGSSRRKQTFRETVSVSPSKVNNSASATCLVASNNHKSLPSSNAKSKATGGGNKSALVPSTQLRPTQVNATATSGCSGGNRCPPAPVPVPVTVPVPEQTSKTVALELATGCVTVETAVSQPLCRSPRKELCYLAHHPRPAAVCTFNARQMGKGFFVCDRRLDATRTALRAALGERPSHPPPIKKLCVESRLPPVPEPSDPSDPYSFACNDNVTAKSCPAAQASAANTACSPAPQPPPRPVSLPVPLLATCPPVPMTFGSPTNRTSSSPLCPSPSSTVPPVTPKPPAVKKVTSKTRSNRDAPSSTPKRKRSSNNVSVPTPVTCSNSVLVSPGTGGGGSGPNSVLSVSFPVNLPGIPVQPQQTVHPAARTGTGLLAARTHVVDSFSDMNLLVTNVGVVNGQLMPSVQHGKAMTNLTAGFGYQQNRLGHGFAASPTVSALLAAPKKGKGASNRSRAPRTSPMHSPTTTVTMAVLGGGIGALSSSGLFGGVTHANNHVTQVSPSGKSPSPIMRSGSVSPQVLTNGLGASPPPTPIYSKGVLNHNHVGRTSSPDLPSPSGAAEGKTCGSRQDAVPAAPASKGSQGGPRVAPRVVSHPQMQRASMNSSAVAADGSAANSSARSHGYAGARQGINAAAAVNRNAQQAAGKRMSQPVPMKMLSGTSSKQLLAKPFLLQGEDMRRQEMHGSQSLPT